MRRSRGHEHDRMHARRGLGGAIEKFITGWVLSPMYAEELRLLEAAAADPHGTATAATARV